MSWATEVLWLTRPNLTRYKQKGRSTVLVLAAQSLLHFDVKTSVSTSCVSHSRYTFRWSDWKSQRNHRVATQSPSYVANRKGKTSEFQNPFPV